MLLYGHRKSKTDISRRGKQKQKIRIALAKSQRREGRPKAEGERSFTRAETLRRRDWILRWPRMRASRLSRLRNRLFVIYSASLRLCVSASLRLRASRLLTCFSFAALRLRESCLRLCYLPHGPLVYPVVNPVTFSESESA